MKERRRRREHSLTYFQGKRSVEGVRSFGERARGSQATHRSTWKPWLFLRAFNVLDEIFMEIRVYLSRRSHYASMEGASDIYGGFVITADAMESLYFLREDSALVSGETCVSVRCFKSNSL